METCSVYQDEQQIVVRIEDDPLCKDCIVSSVIPKFHAALEHEADYPPAWGRHHLHPKDFKQWLDDAEDFMKKWQVKEQEYRMPVAKRLYCGDCQESMSCKVYGTALLLFPCTQCKAQVCSACGRTVEGDEEHTCGQSTSPFEGLARGQDYQLCPNEACGVPVQLRDGCNHVPTLESTGAPNARFDRAPQPAYALPREDRPQQAPTTAAAIEAMNRMVWNDIPTEIIQRLPLLPALPIPPAAEDDHTYAVRLRAEQDMAAELLATEFDVLIRHHQVAIDTYLEIAYGRFLLVQIAEQPLAAILESTIDMLFKLRINLDVFVWRERVALGDEGYGRRRFGIMGCFIANIQGYRDGPLHALFPLLMNILANYRLIVMDRDMWTMDPILGDWVGK